MPHTPSGKAPSNICSLHFFKIHSEIISHFLSCTNSGFLTISSFLFSRNLHHFNVQVSVISKPTNTPTRKSTIFHHTYICKLENHVLQQRKGKKGQIFLPASETDCSFAQKQADSPVQPAVTSGCSNQPHCCVTLPSRCETQPSSVSQHATDKTSPRLSHPAATVARRLPRAQTRFAFSKWIFSYNKAYTR